MTMNGRTQPFVPSADEQVQATPVQSVNTSGRPQGSRQYADRERPLRGVKLLSNIRETGWRPTPLLEIAPLECKFESKQRIKWGTPIQCLFTAVDNDHMQTVFGRVHWSRKVKDTWQNGVFFDAPLDPEFASASGEDMRTNLRYEVQWPAIVKFTSSSVRHNAMIQDYSIDGVSFTGHFPLPIPSQFQLYGWQPNATEPIAGGVIRWQEPFTHGDTMIGARASGRELSWFFAFPRR